MYAGGHLTSWVMKIAFDAHTPGVVLYERSDLDELVIVAPPVIFNGLDLQTYAC